MQPDDDCDREDPREAQRGASTCPVCSAPGHWRSPAPGPIDPECSAHLLRVLSMRIEARGGPRPHATGLGRLGVTRRPHGAVVQNTPRGIVVAVSRPATSTTAAGWAGSARVIDGELVIGPALRAYVRAEGADELALRAELLALLAVRGVVAR